MKRIKGYYFITDSALSRAGNLSDVKNAVQAGIGVVQYREKQKSTKEMHEGALKLRKICRGIAFLVNDRVDIALSVGADGVHLGQFDLPYKIARKILGKNKIIGLTVHNLKQAKAAQRQGADYLGVSPIFATATKKDAGKPVGLAMLKRIKQAVAIPVVAIGGINLSNIEKVVRTGADGICAISAVVTKKDIKTQIKKIQACIKKGREK